MGTEEMGPASILQPWTKIACYSPRAMGGAIPGISNDTG